MGNLVYQSKTSLDGPWLVSSKSLEELDAIIAEYWNKFESRRKKLLKKDTREFSKKYAHIEAEYKTEVNEQIKNYKDSSPLSKSFKVISIYIRNAPTYTCKSFRDAFRGRYLLDKYPTGFSISFVSGDITFDMFIDLSSPELLIEVEPEEVSEVQEIYTAVYEWARDVQRQYVGKRIWNIIAKFRRVILSLGIIILITLFFLTQFFRISNAREQLRTLSAQGVTNSNILDVVNLLVGIHLNTNIVISPYLLLCFWVLLYIGLILTIYPKVAIGIGRGRDALLYWNIWQWVILIPPTFLIGNIFKPYLAELIRNFLLLFP